MTYHFARIKVHPKLDLTAWYLVIRKEAVNLTMDMHKSAATSMFLRFFRDPHLFDQKTWKAKNAYGEFFNPVKLSAGWLQTALNGLSQFGVVYMGTAHGLLFGERVEIVEERTSEKLEFPKGDEHKEGVKITISRWAAGEHYYLNASNNQVFAQPKFDTYEEALAEARKHAFEGNIAFKPGDYQYKNEGD